MIKETVRDIEREEAREALREAALESWRDYEETGLHASGEEIVRWIETWGTDNERKRRNVTPGSHHSLCWR